jgi:RNA polymerase sigma-70 factor (sigma-E family)
MYMPLRSLVATDHRRAETDQFVSSLFRAHSPALLRLALLLVGDRPSAEDVVQEAFIGLHRARLRNQDKALPYLRVAVVNGCRSVHRARRRAAALGPQHEPPVWSAEAAVISREDRREVLAAVARLPRRPREVLALRYSLGLPDTEIAATLGISRGTVSSTVSRALTALARDLKEDL